MSKLGTYTLPVEPDATSYVVGALHVAGHRRGLSGNMNSFYAASKRRWHVAVPGLTDAQRAALMTELEKLAHLAWEPPEGGSYTVYVVGQPQAAPTKDAEAYWTVTFDLEQV